MEEPIFYIRSCFLKEIEPLLQKYYDYDSSMLYDNIRDCVIAHNVKCTEIIDGVLHTDYYKAFYSDERLALKDHTYTHRNGVDKNVTYKDLADELPQYFDFGGENRERVTNDYFVYLCLEYMGYIFFLQEEGAFDRSILVGDLDLEYQYTLHNSIYPEMLSLYKMILESKKYKRRGDKVTITYKQDKIDINSCAWFLDDMEKYFKDRFPNLTLDQINELLPTPKKAGRKFTDRTTTNIIWGTYQLLKNHHSKFNNSNVKISKEICQFIINYLNHIGIKHDLIDTDIKDTLKDMIKRNYVPRWDLPWRNMFSGIKEKELGEQPLRKYNLSNL